MALGLPSITDPFRGRRGAIRPIRRDDPAAWPWLAGLLVGLFLLGCSVPVATDLDESDANRVTVALQQSGISAQKTVDRQNRDRFGVLVSRDDASFALAVLAAHSLPKPPTAGVLKALGGQTLVPTENAERARLLVGTAGELERSLTAIDGIIDARVHLAVAPRESLIDDTKPPPPKASVLLRYQGQAPAVTIDQVKLLVAGAVPDLVPERVSVVSTPIGPLPKRDSKMARFGPLTVTRGSLTILRTMAASVVAVFLACGALLLWLWRRSHASRQISPGSTKNSPDSFSEPGAASRSSGN